LFRVAQYLADRIYWMDELALAGNIHQMSAGRIFGPLRATQLAPPGFLALETLACAAFGPSRLALRLVPLLGGVAALVLFWRVSRAVLRPPAALIAVALFAVSDDLIAYSAELKQYETDVALGLVCTWMGLSLARRPATTARWLVAASAGAVVVWFSHTSAFVLAGVGVVLLASAAVERQWRRFGALVLTTGTWALSFAAVHAVAMNQLGHSRDMWVFWGFAFPPMPPVSAWEASWPVRRLLYVFVNPLDYYWPFGYLLSTLPALGCFAVGVASLWKRDRILLGMLLAPVGFTLLATQLHLYPFHGRLILFLVPAFILTIAEGAGRIAAHFDRRAARAVVVGSVLFFPTLRAAYHLETPRQRDDFNERGDRRPNKLDPRTFPF
jgi:hypothetical protein